jgi:very-short-patch-repair endonuclease
VTRKPAIAVLSQLGLRTHGVFRGREAERRGVTRDQLTTLLRTGVIVRELRDTYRVAAVQKSPEQRLHAALLWAGDGSAAARASAGAVYELEGVRHPATPEIVLPRARRARSDLVVVHRTSNPPALMLGTRRGFRVTGVEATLLALAGVLAGEQLEIACEDARRRRLTSVPALQAYLERFGTSGRNGTAALRRLLRELDAKHPSRSTLEVKARRLLVAHGRREFIREFPLTWHGRTYRFDFAFPAARVIVETNGRRWHDDPVDYEADQEKWSVPARHGYRIVFATWDKVTRRPEALLAELAATLRASAAPSPRGRARADRSPPT